MRKHLILVFFLSLITAIAELGSIVIFYPYLDFVLNNNYPSNLILSKIFNKDTNADLFTLVLLLVFFLKFILVLLHVNYISSVCYDYQSKIIQCIIRNFFREKIINRNISKSDYLRKLISDSSVIAGTFFIPFFSLITEIILCLFIFFILLNLNFYFTILAFLTISFISFVSYKIVRNKLYNLGHKKVYFEKKKILELETAFHGLKEIKFRNLMHSVLLYLDKDISNLSDVTKKQTIISAFPRVFIELFAYLSILLTIIFLKDSDIQNLLPLIGVFSIAVLRLLPSFNKIINSLTQLKYSQPIIKSLNISGNSKTSLIKKNYFSRKFSTFKKNSEIIFSAKQFSYSKKNFFYRMNSFKIFNGEWVRLDGKSGSGKTLYLDNVATLDNFNKKYFTWNSFILGDNLEEVYYLSQNSFVKEGTILENMLFGVDKNLINKKSILKALDVVKFKSKSFNELNIIKSSSLSGGEKQKVSLCRMLLNNPKFIILDEPTSALDEETSNSIFLNIKKNYRNISCLFVSHHSNCKYSDNKIKIYNDESYRKKKFFK